MERLLLQQYTQEEIVQLNVSELASGVNMLNVYVQGNDELYNGLILKK